MTLPGYVKIKDFGNKIQIESTLDGTKIELDDSKYVEDLRKIQKGEKANNEELITALVDNKMLLDLKRYKEISSEVRELMNKHIMLTILPTEGCNFRCTYCYENHNNSFMKEEIYDEIVKYIETQAQTAKKITINWFGGEPTLCAETVLSYNVKMRHIAESNNIKFESSMTTNGYLLTEELFKRFYEAGITNYQITLDGFEHDKKRVLCNGQGTLTKILTNLREITKLPRSYKYTIYLRRNILKDEDLEWYDFLADAFSEDKRFKLNIRKVADLGGESVKSLNLVDKADILTEHINYAKKRFKLLDDEISYAPYSSMCYAAYPKGFVICTDGSLQKCTTALYEEYNMVGKVIPGKGFQIDEKKNRIWTECNVSEKCLSCKKSLSCNNLQCPKRVVLNSQCLCCG